MQARGCCGGGGDSTSVECLFSITPMPGTISAFPGTTQGAAGRLKLRSSHRGVVAGSVSSTRAILAAV
jgi:hypothetical protein